MIAPSSAAYHLAEHGLVKLVPLRDEELKREVTINTHVDKTITKAMSLVIDKVVTLSREANVSGAWTGDFIYRNPEAELCQSKSNVNYLAACK